MSSKYPKLSELPAALITSKDACKFLGLKLSNGRNRLRQLRYSIVALNGQRCKVYRRDEVEALADTPIPEGFTDLKALAAEFKISTAMAYFILRRADVTRQRILCTHPFFVYSHADAADAISKHKAAQPAHV